MASKSGNRNCRELEFCGFRTCLSGVVFEVNLNLQLIARMPDGDERRGSRKECIEIATGHPLKLSRVGLIESGFVDTEEADVDVVGAPIRGLEGTETVEPIHELAGLDRLSDRGLCFGLSDQRTWVYAIWIGSGGGGALAESLEDAYGEESEQR